MKLVYFFYVFITFSIGMVSLGIATIVFIKTKEHIVQTYLYFHIAFTLLVVSTMFLLYMKTAVSYIPPYAYTAIKYFADFVASHLLMVTIPIFVHCLFSVPHAKLKNAIFAGVMVVSYSIHHFFEFATNRATAERIGDHIVGTIFLATILYSFFLGLDYLKKTQDAVKKKITVKLVIIIGISLPGIAYNLFRHDNPIQFFPAVYCGISIIFMFHFIKHYFNQPHVSTDILPDASTQTLSDEALFQQYNISPREKEIIELLLQGYSNQKMGELLYISLSTVKTHLRNIYSKFGVRSRYELITFFQNTKEESVIGPTNQGA